MYTSANSIYILTDMATTNSTTDIQESQQKSCSGCPKWTPTSPEKFEDAENKMYKGND